MTLLPGRIAVLVPDEKPTVIAIPDKLKEKWRSIAHPILEPEMGVVIKTGRSRGRVPMPCVGEDVYVKPKEGLTIVPNDIDTPHLGKFVPKGYTLRIYGRIDEPWHDAIYCGVEE